MPLKDRVKRNAYKAKWCRDKRIKDKEWASKQDERCNSQKKTKYYTDPEYRAKRIASAKALTDKKRKAAIDYYGGKCACCGETEYAFLAFDHIDGGGNKHRRNEKIGNMGRWAYDNGFPDILQILCHNCNSAKGFYGECPHKSKDMKL